MSWGTNHDASIEKLQKVQGSLTVGLLMVSRNDFVTCRPTDTAESVASKNTLNFSFFPVEDEGRILGLYNAERWFRVEAPEDPIGNDYQRLSEDILIAADASIFDFIMQADRHPTNLVVSGNQIAGLVSLSDIQQLPVRAALFSAITSFEMAMAMAIETRWQDTNEWIAKLPEDRQKRLQAELEKSREGDTALAEIAYTQFCDKKTLVINGGVFSSGKKKLNTSLGRIERLRNDLAHSNEYASSSEKAKKVCQTVSDLYDLKTTLLNFIKDSGSERAQ
jgi:hypothetical protein